MKVFFPVPQNLKVWERLIGASLHVLQMKIRKLAKISLSPAVQLVRNRTSKPRVPQYGFWEEGHSQSFLSCQMSIQGHRGPAFCPCRGNLGLCSPIWDNQSAKPIIYNPSSFHVRATVCHPWRAPRTTKQFHSAMTTRIFYIPYQTLQKSNVYKANKCE